MRPLRLSALFALSALSALSAPTSCTGLDRAGPPSEAPSAAPSAILARVRASSPSFATFGRSAPRTGFARVAVPDHADGAASIGLDPSRTLTIRALGVGHVASRKSEHASVFINAAAAVDLLLASEDDRFEEVRVLHAGASPILQWSIEASDGISAVRLRGHAVEALDRAGRVVVRTGELFAVDQSGTRRTPALSLTHESSTRESPTRESPTRESPTRESYAREGSRYFLTATLDTSGLSFPIVHDPVWLAGPTMEVGRSGHRAVVVPDGKVYLGCDGTRRFEVFDPATSNFTVRASLVAAPSDCAMTFVKGKLRVVGLDESVSTYDIATDTWTPGATGVNPRVRGVVVTLTDGRTLVATGQAGGLTGGEFPVASADVYDPTTNTWGSVGSMKNARNDSAAVLLPNGKVLVAGGINAERLSAVELFDPSTNTWSIGPSLPSPVSGAGIAVVGTRAIIIAGSGEKGETAQTAVYDPATNAISVGPSLSAARSDVMAAVTSDGRLFVIGGTLAGEAASSGVEVADAALTKFAPSAKMFLPRARATASALLDGRILVTGGLSLMGLHTSSELLSAFANGSSCSWGGECGSGFCASGVCCNTECASGCERCDVTGKVGVCAAAPAGTECGSAPACAGSTLSARGRCDGTTSKCASPSPTACAGALVCADSTTCLARCARDADCTTGSCDPATGLCVPRTSDAGPPIAPVPEGSPKLLGSALPCTSASQCSTGFCVDGVCCDSPCTETCHSCALPSAPGRCTEEPLGVDLRNECGAALSCAGTCGKGGVCTTSVAGSQCAPSTCTGASTGKGASICAASGVPCDTSASVPFDCGAYVCEAAFGACRTSCTESTSCASGFICNPTSKSCEQLPEAGDEGCAVSTAGRPANSGIGSLGALGALLFMASRVSRRRSR